MLTVLLLLGFASAGEDPCKNKPPGHVLSEHSSRLGNGFRQVRRQQCNGPDVWEAIGHFDFLYFKKLELGRVGQLSISPSGRFALFESVGRLLLFDAEHRNMRDVTDGEFAVPKLLKWDEKRKIVTVTYYEDHSPSTINLPE